LLSLWVGALAAKASSHTDIDYLLGNRSFGKYFIGLSAGATRNSGWIMVGVVGMAYSMGISALLMLIISGLNQIDPKLTDITAVGLTGWIIVAYLVGFFFLGFGAGISQPHVLVRLLAGRSSEEVKQAKWIFLAYVYLTWAVMILFGVICRVLIPDLDDPEQALLCDEKFSSAVRGYCVGRCFYCFYRRFSTPCLF
jgi:Na+/proline symporter